jgi:hypothetical protein
MRSQEDALPRSIIKTPLTRVRRSEKIMMSRSPLRQNAQAASAGMRYVCRTDIGTRMLKLRISILRSRLFLATLPIFTNVQL